MNDYTWGGFLIWTMPERKLFIEGRLPQYELNGRSMLEEYYTFFAEVELEDQINKYNIELIFLRKELEISYSWLEKLIFGFIINNNSEEKEVDPLRKYLNSQENWEQVYDDSNADIYVKH